MTSPERRRRTAGLLTAVLPLAAVLVGCSVGQASTFTGRAEASCRAATQQIGTAPTSGVPRDLLAFALDRYTDIERVVAEVNTDIAFPGGARGRVLRQHWTDPAERSLDAGRDDLRQLRAAVVANDRDAANRAFAKSVEAGTEGVDPAVLRAAGLDDCAALFAPSALV